jgi:hypothetical protein
MPIIKEVEGGDEVGDNIWGDKDHVEDEKHDELLNVFLLSTIESAWNRFYSKLLNQQNWNFQCTYFIG